MRKPRRYLTILLLLVGISGAGFVLQSDKYFLIKKNFTIFSEVYEKVSSIYIDEVDPESLMRVGINSMLDELDPYTVLIDENESRQMEMVTTGQYAGIGLEVGARGGQLVVIAPVEGYSAERRGVRAGDVIRKVDGLDVSKMNAEDLQSLLRGDPGSSVTLTIERYGISEPLDFNLTRETIEIRNVTYYDVIDSEARIGYILLRRFAQNAAEEVREAIIDMEREGPLDGLVLDLRNNPGGLLDEAVKIIDKFVPAGENVVWTEGRMTRSNQRYETTEDPVYPDKPLAVLQNNGSASASEIVSGALQDLDRAVIVGERSFGKGLVQIVQPLSYNMSLKITTSKYFIPSGRSIQSTPYISEEEVARMDVVPDSLRTRFQTRSGRGVYEGIGIEPDIIVELRPQSMLEIALLKNSHYFFFANEYASREEALNSNSNSEELINQFREYLDKQDFSYTTRAERNLEEFIASLDATTKDASVDKLDMMKELVELEKEREKAHYSDHIRQEIYLELISRYEGRTGRIRKQLETDEAALKAIDVILSTDRYASILKP